MSHSQKTLSEENRRIVTDALYLCLHGKKLTEEETQDFESNGWGWNDEDGTWENPSKLVEAR
ncbi:MAG: hypothetical protein GY841_02745 [FCB group bacterium]|nr:hypothetical protein [FCB group bacterium]